MSEKGIGGWGGALNHCCIIQFICYLNLYPFAAHFNAIPCNDFMGLDGCVPFSLSRCLIIILYPLD